MRTRTKTRFLVSLAVLAASLVAVPQAAHAAPVVVSQVAKNGTKGYLLVDGKPFTIGGVQSFGEWQTYGNDSMNPIPTNQSTRILPQDWLENTFEKTAAAGFSTIQIELAWNQIEPTTQGVYDWTLIDKYVTWAKKYNLKIDIVWWGANGCGGGVLPGSAHGFMTSIPAYLQDQNRYWGNGNNGEEVFPYLPISGDPHYTDANYLFSSERTAVTAMFNHLATSDTTHQTIMFQVYNEPGNTSTWNSQHDLWLSLINQLGGAVKSSDYVVATRVNLTGARIDTYNSTNDLIGTLPNIDFVGPDDYNLNVSDIAAAVTDTAAKSKVAYIPETFSNNASLTSIEATALVNGGFANFWQLNNSWAGSAYAFYGSPSQGYPSYTTWTVGTMPPLPQGVSRIQRFNTGINKMTQLVAPALSSDMVGFNIGTNVPATSYTGHAMVDGAKISYTTADGSIGMALYDHASNSYYLVSDTGTSATFNLNSPSATAAVGYFDSSGTWNSQGNRSVASNGDIQINPGELVKVSNVALAGGITSGLTRSPVGCVDDLGNSTDPNTAKVDIWDCNGSAAQRWTTGPNNTLQINGLCMDALGGQPVAGTNVGLWACNGGANQQWFPQGDGSLKNGMQSPTYQTGLCLDDPASDSTNGKQLEIWNCNGGANQQWIMP